VTISIVYTVGHSTRVLEELVRILRRRRVDLVIDVRRFPGSRRFPWFRRENLERELPRRGIEYLWVGNALGGFRRVGVDVPELRGASCFESPGFRAYALYATSSEEAWRAIMRLEELARRRLVAILCRERLPWRCHRKIISDILVLHGFRVIHVIDDEREVIHKPARCAKLMPGGRVVYI